MKRTQRARGKLTLLLVAIAAALYGASAQADETDPPKERTVADVVNEARARVEAKERAERGAPISNWQGYKKPDEVAKVENASKPEPMAAWVGFRMEKWTKPYLGDLYRIRAAQREAAALEYLEPQDDFVVEPNESSSAILGFELNRWLDMELILSPLHRLWEINDGRDLRDTAEVRDRKSTHHSFYEESSYMVSFLPRKNIRTGISVYGRLGVGYAMSSMGSTLSVQGRTGTTRVCRQDPKDASKQECYDQPVYESTAVEDFRRNKDGFYPIVGVGVDFVGMVRLEYIVRSNLPLQGSHISAGPTFALTFFTTRFNDSTFGMY